MEDSERRKAIELLKEMRSENKTIDGSSNQETRLNWMYKGPSDLVDKEEYLLGKAIDKMFEVLSTSGNSDVVGRTGEQSNVPKRMLEKTDNTEQVDIAKKILEDPLYAIKQKEMEARKKLLNNPVKLKQIKQMLLERNKQRSSHMQKKKKLKKKSEQDLNLLIIRKLRKFTDKEKRKALSKIMELDSGSSSTESSSSSDEHYKKRKSKKKRRHSLNDETDSSTYSSSSGEESEEIKSKAKKHRREASRRKKQKKIRNTNPLTNYDSGRKKKSTNKKHSRKPSSSRSHSESSSDGKSNKKLQDENLRDSKNVKTRHLKRDLNERRRHRSDERQDKDRRNREIGKGENFHDRHRKFGRDYGLMMPDGSKPEMRKKSSPIQKYEKNVKKTNKYTPPAKPKALSEKEKEDKLKEMMEDAKLRKADREKNLANHRKKQAEEEESKAYDDDFMRRQMSHLTGQGTMSDRIKSKINNIQRSESSMDTNFMRK